MREKEEITTKCQLLALHFPPSQQNSTLKHMLVVTHSENYSQTLCLVLASFDFLFSTLSTCNSAGSHSTLSFHFKPQQAAALREESLNTYSTQEPVSDWLMNTVHRLVQPRSISQASVKTTTAKNERIFKILSDTRLFSQFISVFLSPQLYIMLDCSHILSHLVLSLHLFVQNVNW